MIEGREGRVCRHSSKEAVFALLWNHGTQRENEGDTRIHRKGVQGHGVNGADLRLVDVFR